MLNAVKVTAREPVSTFSADVDTASYSNVRRFLNIYVNDEDIRFLGKDYKFKQGDEVTLVPSIAGG